MSTTASLPKTPLKKKLKLNTYPWYSPRFWHGMCLGDWLRLLKRGRYRVHPLRMVMAGNITLCAGVNSSLTLLQNLIYGRQIAATEIKQPPIFIIGHWRSGTTYLHELMVCDKRFSYPTYYECFEPNHFLLSGWLFPKLLWPLLPGKRPMDNMETGWHRPQEDEFALLAMGAPTPYFRMAFPERAAAGQRIFGYGRLPARGFGALAARHAAVRANAHLRKKGKRLIMKSPPHTGRIGELAKFFPGAKFIHIVRDPSTVFPSTKRLWVSLDEAQGLQHPHHNDLDEYILATFERMYRGFNRQRPSIADNQICELKYEDLVRDPMQELRRIY